MALNGYPPEEGWKLKQLLDAHYPLIPGLVKYAYRKYGYNCGPAERDDLCHDIYVSLRERDCERLDEFRGECDFKTLLFIVVMRYIGKDLQKRRRWVSWEDEKLDPPSNEVSAEERLLVKSRLEALFAAAHQLPKRKQEVFWLLCEGLGEEEIAKRMNVKTETVYRYKSEMIDELAALIEGGGAMV